MKLTPPVFSLLSRPAAGFIIPVILGFFTLWVTPAFAQLSGSPWRSGTINDVNGITFDIGARRTVQSVVINGYATSAHRFNFSGANFSGMDLHAAEFVNGYNFGSGVPERPINFSNANLRGARFTECSMNGSNFSNADLEGAYLTDAALARCNFEGANLKNSSSYNSGFYNANLKNADLSNSQFQSSYLKSADLREANLSGANFTRAFMAEADFRGANLAGADLTEANLWGADLTGADLTGATLARANLGNVKGYVTEKDRRIAELEAQLSTVTAERDARMTQAAHEAAIAVKTAQIATLAGQLSQRPSHAAFDAIVVERDAAITERDERPTVEQMQDARVGSIVVEKDWQSGEVSLSLGLEKTEDGVTWTAYEGGTWTETAGGKFTLSFPLTETKNWVRLALKE